MSKGYVAIVQNSGDNDYLTQAYGLALSLKNTQTEINNLTILVDEPTRKLITHKHQRVFDNIIDLPWEDEAENEEWKVNNKWKVYYATPYDETVLLDSDMVFPTDVSHWWPILAQKEFWSATKVRNYRNEVITDNLYRKAFEENNLPNIYNAFMYFKKSEVCSEIFKLAEIIFHNWQRFYHLYLPNSKPRHVSGDVVFALAIKILGYEHLTTRENIDSMPTFVHMKGDIQGVNTVGRDWTLNLSSHWVKPDNLVVGNFRQTVPFHYVDKAWLKDRDIKLLEQGLGL